MMKNAEQARRFARSAGLPRVSGGRSITAATESTFPPQFTKRKRIKKKKAAAGTDSRSVTSRDEATRPAVLIVADHSNLDTDDILRQIWPAHDRAAAT